MPTSDNFTEILAARLGDRTFCRLYRSTEFVYASTCTASVECFEAVSTLLATRSLDWLVPLRTFTSRQMFVGHLSDEYSNVLPDLIFKRSNFRARSTQMPSEGIISCRQEIRMSLVLAALLEDLQESGRLPVPDGFSSCSVRVENPMGWLIDRVRQSSYSVFAFEHGFDTGEMLLFSDPPIHGAVSYSRRQWQEYCAILGFLDIISAEALQRNIQLDHLGVHQVLYRSSEHERTLDMVLIDAERIHVI